MTFKTVLLIVAYHGYQPVEYGVTRKVLEEAGITVFGLLRPFLGRYLAIKDIYWHKNL